MSLRFRVVLAIAVLLLSGAVVGTALAGWQAKQVLREELAAALAGGARPSPGPSSPCPAQTIRRGTLGAWLPLSTVIAI
jgi:hypothetical protein